MISCWVVEIVVGRVVVVVGAGVVVVVVVVVGAGVVVVVVVVVGAGVVVVVVVVVGAGVVVVVVVVDVVVIGSSQVGHHIGHGLAIGLVGAPLQRGLYSCG